MNCSFAFGQSENVKTSEVGKWMVLAIVYPIMGFRSCKPPNNIVYLRSSQQKRAKRTILKSLVRFNCFLVMRIELLVTICVGPESWHVAHQLLGLVGGALSDREMHAGDLRGTQ